MATWLQLCQAAADELGLDPRPISIAQASDLQSRQLGQLANRCGALLVRKKDWTTLQSTCVINVAPPVITTGNTTRGSTVVSGIASAAGLAAGTWVMQAAGFVQAPRVLSVDSPTQVTLDTQATATATGITLTFSKDTYDVPADFQVFLDQTMWDRSRRWQLLGPELPSEDAALRSGIIAPVPRRRWRQVGRTSSSFRLWPPPSATDTPATVVFDYVSGFWAQDAQGTPKAQFSADTDSCVFGDDLMVMGIKWLWMQAKGFAFLDLAAAWNEQVGIAMAQDGGAPDLSLIKRRIWDPLDPAAVTVQVVQGS